MSIQPQNTPLFGSIRQLIEESKQQVAVAVNTTMSKLYWQIGNKINEELSHYSLAESYGKLIVVSMIRYFNWSHNKILWLGAL